MAGPKVTVREAAAPSAQVLAKARAEVVVHDSEGRSITLRKPGVLAQYRLVEALGDAAKNEVYTSMVLPLIYVWAIDDDHVPPATRKSQIEALIQRLDEHGIAAVVKGVQEHFGRVDPEKDKAELGN